MACLTIRGIEQAVYDRLRARAARLGISVAEEVRQILRRSVSPSESIGTLAVEHLGRTDGVKLELPPRAPHDPIDLQGS